MLTILRVLRAAEPVRLYLYGLTAPLFALAVAYGLLTASNAALWAALAAAVLVPGVELARRAVQPIGRRQG